MQKNTAIKQKVSRMKTFLIDASVVDRIERRVAEKRMTRRDLARRSGVSERSIYKMLLGNAELRASTIQGLADALDLSFDEIISGDKSIHTQTKSQPMILREADVEISLKQAIEVIAKQFHLSQDRVMKAISDLMMEDE